MDRNRLPARFEGAEWLHFDPEEEPLWAGHPSRMAYLPRYLTGIALVVAGLVGVALLGEFALLGVAGVALGFLVGGRAHYERISTAYVITTERVYHKRGLISRNVSQIRYDRVQNTSYSQSVLERLFSYGDVGVTSAGTGQVEILLRSIPDPVRIKRLVSDQLAGTTRSGSGPSHAADPHRSLTTPDRDRSRTSER